MWRYSVAVFLILVSCKEWRSIKEGYRINDRVHLPTHRIVKIIDGDTYIAEALHHNAIDTVRLRLADAPEYGQAYFEEAKEFAYYEIEGKKVILNGKERDRYHRLLCRITYFKGASGTKKKLDFSSEIIREGLAYYYDKYEEDENLAFLEQLARDAELNLWSLEEEEKPWEYRIEEP